MTNRARECIVFSICAGRAIGVNHPTHLAGRVTRGENTSCICEMRDVSHHLGERLATRLLERRAHFTDDGITVVDMTLECGPYTFVQLAQKVAHDDVCNAFDDAVERRRAQVGAACTLNRARGFNSNTREFFTKRICITTRLLLEVVQHGVGAQRRALATHVGDDGILVVSQDTLGDAHHRIKHRGNRRCTMLEYRLVELWHDGRC